MRPSYLSNIVEWPTELHWYWTAGPRFRRLPVRWPELFTAYATLSKN